MMIIPRATFLHQAYIRAGATHQHQISREKMLFRGRIARKLRLPANHSLGRVTLMLFRKDYPVLTGECGASSLACIRNEVVSSGYAVDVEKLENGNILFSIDWTNSTLSTSGARAMLSAGEEESATPYIKQVK